MVLLECRWKANEGPHQIDFYTPIPTGMIPNDDLDLQVVWACISDDMSEPKVDRNILAKVWQDYIGFLRCEYGIALRNMSNIFYSDLSICN